MSQLLLLPPPGTCQVWKIPLSAWLLPLWPRSAFWTPLLSGPAIRLQRLPEYWVPLGGSRAFSSPEMGCRAGNLGSISAFDLGATHSPPWELGHTLHGLRPLAAQVSHGPSWEPVELGMGTGQPWTSWPCPLLRPQGQPGGPASALPLSWSAEAEPRGPGSVLALLATHLGKVCGKQGAIPSSVKGDLSHLLGHLRGHCQGPMTLRLRKCSVDCETALWLKGFVE